jgi:hypothetical protein
MTTSKPAPLDDLNDGERATLTEGLRALCRERGQDWNAACDVVEVAGRPTIVRPFGIDGIKALAPRRQPVLSID